MKIIYNTKNINMINEKTRLALLDTAEAVKTDLIQSQTMPFRTGNLQNDNTFVDDERVKNGIVKIVSDTPYARKLYFHPEYNFYRGTKKAKTYKRKQLKAKTIEEGAKNKSKKNRKRAVRRVRKYNKNAGGRWFDTYVDGAKKELPLKYYKKILKRRMKL